MASLQDQLLKLQDKTSDAASPGTAASTSEKAIAVLALLGVDKESAVPSARLDSLGITSLDRIELTIRIEEHFGFRTTDTAVFALETVLDLIDYAEHKGEQH
ncbi:acyl carrier protein [Corynebacterium pseudotuberculosis FRC41]|uniref:acyl carrier protein n=1 Tax=Corynebacterium pseudotuberculosis TaxID=1719 RepID=UPI0001DD84CF|nr:acyl carrier protein [Corynebacterium pseudotuberculosis]ADK29300.1 acyl carrier protein [Corynebacterium pseudotuberculosis FRC41]